MDGKLNVRQVLLPDGDVATLADPDGHTVSVLATARAALAGDAYRQPPPPYVPPRPRVRVAEFLEKLGGGTSAFGRRSWKRRWIVLSEGAMTYFKFPEAEAAGAPPLKGASVLVAGFSVAAAEHTMYLRNKVPCGCARHGAAWRASAAHWSPLRAPPGASSPCACARGEHRICGAGHGRCGLTPSSSVPTGSRTLWRTERRASSNMRRAHEHTLGASWPQRSLHCLLRLQPVPATA